MSKEEYLSPSFSPSGSTSPIPSLSIRGDHKADFSNSLDIKRQLSQSMAGVSHGGISKPSSRRGSLIPIKLNEDRDDDDDDDQGNERKRRDNINDKIQELLTLVPEEFFKETITGKETEEELAIRNSGTKDGKPNKGQILTKSVEYIKWLQETIDENNKKEVELLLRLKSMGITNGSRDIGNTSAEVALGKIGVGPLSNEYLKNVLVESANASKAPRRGSIG